MTVPCEKSFRAVGLPFALRGLWCNVSYFRFPTFATQPAPFESVWRIVVGWINDLIYKNPRCAVPDFDYRPTASSRLFGIDLREYDFTFVFYPISHKWNWGDYSHDSIRFGLLLWCPGLADGGKILVHIRISICPPFKEYFPSLKCSATFFVVLCVTNRCTRSPIPAS